MVQDAPGVVWRLRVDGWEAQWKAREDAVWSVRAQYEMIEKKWDLDLAAR